MHQQAHRDYRFEHFDVMPSSRQVWVRGEPVALGGRAYDLLLALIEHRDGVVSKNALLTQIWPGQCVEENNLTVQIAALRKVIGPDAITTVAGRGYCFTAREKAERERLDVSNGHALAPDPAAQRLPNVPSIAVLPFANLSGDPAQDYFAEGMVEDLITALAGMKAFFVIARNSSHVFQGRTVDLAAVGAKLGVRYVVQGSVRQAASQVRITARLIEATTGLHVWGDHFDGQLDDIFALQDRITAGIVGSLQTQIRLAEFERTRALPTSNMQAYDLVWRALAKLRPNTTRLDNDEALALVARAIELDPHFAQAKALGALASMTRIVEGYGDTSDVTTGLRYADQALADNTDDPTTLCHAGVALAALGFRAFGVRVLGFRYEEASRAIERALELSPNLITVQYSAATLQLFLCNSEPSIAHWRQCARLSPLDPVKIMFTVGEGAAHMLQGNYDLALAAADFGIREAPSYAMSHRLRVANLGFLGRLEEARVAARRLLELSPALTVTRYRAVAPYRDAAFRARSAAIYRAAGVPR